MGERRNQEKMRGRGMLLGGRTCFQFARRGSKGYDWYFKQLKRDEELARIAKIDRENEKLKRLLPEPLWLDGNENGEKKRIKVFMKFAIGTDEPRKVTFELANDVLPRTCENFVKLCNGEDENLRYKGNQVHMIQKGQFICAGDVTNGDGSGGHSALGTRTFEDEGFYIRHARGILSMANAGVDTNTSQFFITVSKCSHLDGRNVAFGAVIHGMDVLDEISRIICVDSRPVTNVTIADCGQVH